jgi:hypothetical protein
MIIETNRFRLYNLTDREINTIKKAVAIIIFEESKLQSNEDKLINNEVFK